MVQSGGKLEMLHSICSSDKMITFLRKNNQIDIKTNMDGLYKKIIND
jgi:hypothetical protein